MGLWGGTVRDGRKRGRIRRELWLGRRRRRPSKAEGLWRRVVEVSYSRGLYEEGYMDKGDGGG